MSTITLTDYQSSLIGGQIFLSLNGTVTDCKSQSLFFKILCNDYPPIIVPTQNNSGTWSLTVQTPCACIDRIQIEAQCADEGYHQVVNGSIPPSSAPDCCCPNAKAVITSEVKEPCQNLTKEVIIQATITPIPKPGCPQTIAAEMYVDDQLVATDSGTSPFTLNHDGYYPCGEHTITIKYPDSNCPDESGHFCVSACESSDCKWRRYSFEVSSTVAVISLILYIFNSSYFYLLLLAIVAAILSVLAYVRWKPCDKACQKCPCYLSVWEILLASFVGFLVLSKSTLLHIYHFLVGLLGFSGFFASALAILIILIILLIILWIIYLFYKKWANRCCPTVCEKWSNLKETLLDVAAIAFGIVEGVIFSQYGATDAGLFLLPHATTIWALITLWVSWKKNNACGS